MESPETVVMQLPEKTPRINFCGITKNGNFGVALCNTGPLCTCSVVRCSAWETSSNHREDDRHRQGRDRGRQAECQTALNCMLCLHGGDIMGVARSCRVKPSPQRTANSATQRTGVNFVCHTSRGETLSFFYGIAFGFGLGSWNTIRPSWCSHLISAPATLIIHHGQDRLHHFDTLVENVHLA